MPTPPGARPFPWCHGWPAGHLAVDRRARRTRAARHFLRCRRLPVTTRAPPLTARALGNVLHTPTPPSRLESAILSCSALRPKPIVGGAKSQRERARATVLSVK